MSDDSVFLVTELWMIPGSFKKFKEYKIKVDNILEKYNPHYLFHNHPFERVFDANDETHPTGLGIIRFENENLARAAIDELSSNAVKALEKEVFYRIRSYLSRYAPPDGLKDGMHLGS